jgi:phospholipid/cholesterol/gamma-HCH transport system permease protein
MSSSFKKPNTLNYSHAVLTPGESADTVICTGQWIRSNITSYLNDESYFANRLKNAKVLDAGRLEKLDTCGAWFLCRLIQQYNPTITIKNLKNSQRVLFNMLTKYAPLIEKSSRSTNKKIKPITAIGQTTVRKCLHALYFFAFLGELFIYGITLVKHTKKLRWKSIFSIVEETGCLALPITGLMSFLIGVVLAYQLSVQLKLYGASIFIVDITGIAILREFAPLITAIIMAGRTSTAFTAFIGTMKVNEEIDALMTSNIHPLECLVIPRILALIICLPLLTVWADIWGIAGSMVMSKSMLDISYASFLVRFGHMVYLRHYVLGLIKTPIFACIIGLVGCFQGLQVSHHAESVGKKTTKSAVQSIFLIIIADALFSIIFSWYGI